MTLRDMIDSGIQIEGHVKIQCWESFDDISPNIYYEGQNIAVASKYFDREVIYMFPYLFPIGVNNYVSAICIELAEEHEDNYSKE